MLRAIAASLLALGLHAFAQTPAPEAFTFEVATIHPVEHDVKGGRFITMQGTHRFVAKDYTLKLLIAAAWSLNPRTISGGPSWLDSDHFDILAETPGENRPTRDQQMAMLRTLLTDRFRLTFHREQKDFSIYQIEIAKGGPKLKPAAEPPDAPPALLSTVYPQRILLPARNASMADLATLFTRAVLDRPVVDKTSLPGRFDFDLEWAPDETQFGGEIPPAPADAQAAPLFTAIQQQLGLRLEATRGPIAALIIDHADHPIPD